MAKTPAVVAAVGSPAGDRRPKPAVAPVSPPSRPTTPALSNKGPAALGPGISIRLGAERKTMAEEPAAATMAPRREQRAAPYTDAAVDVAWENFLQSNPSAHILANTMRTCRPRRLQDDTFIVPVESPAQQQTIETCMQDIRSYICNKLANDLIRFNVEIIEGEGSPRTWTEKEVLAHMLDENPSIRNLMDTLKLSLD